MNRKPKAKHFNQLSGGRKVQVLDKARRIQASLIQELLRGLEPFAQYGLVVANETDTDKVLLYGYYAVKGKEEPVKIELKVPDFRAALLAYESALQVMGA